MWPAWSIPSRPWTQWVSLGEALAASEPPFPYISSWGLDRVTPNSSSGFDLSYF